MIVQKDFEKSFYALHVFGIDERLIIKRDKSVKHFEKSESFTKKKGEKIMTKRFGFTLAEVLITLGIIGVVAAMTMPTLMNSTQGAQYKAAYKKALSAISQGITLNVALDGSSFAEAVQGTAGDTATANTVANILNSRMNVVSAQKGKANNDSYSINGVTKAETNTALFFNDGVVFSFPAADSKSCTNDPDGSGATKKVCTGYIDVNGQKGPNKVVACDGTTTGAACTVSSPTDVYPVKFYDQTILPNSDAARAVLYGKEKELKG